MKKIFSNLLALLLIFCVVLAASCRRADGLNLIVIIDLSASIEAEAVDEAFDAIQSIIGDFRRGDSITIIPVTGDAATESQGRILRFDLDRPREAYDADLKRFAEQIKAEIEKMRTAARSAPFGRSDILGSLAIAAESLSQEKRGSVVVVLSDFLQDDLQYNFKRDARLANERSANELAGEVAKARPNSFKGAAVYLGLLRSEDLKTLPQMRRQAVQRFWEEYLSCQGASISAATDGSGHLSSFLKRARSSKDDGRAD
jgi:hypothetical protein